MRLVLSVVLWLCAAAASAQTEGPKAFEVESLNEGLAAPDRTIGRETPRAALETFMRLGAREDWGRAAHLLELSFLPEEEQQVKGPLLAMQLHTVLKRGVILDWGSLPDRPDAVDVTATTDDPLAGKARRSIRVALLSLPSRSTAVRLARLKPEGGDPVWVFPQQTVEDVPALYARFAPSPLEQMLPAFLKQQALWTLAWWELIALPVVIVLAAGLGALTHRLWGLLRDHSQPLGPLHGVLDAMQLPAALLVFALSFGLAQRLAFTFSGAVSAVLDPIIIAAIVIAVGGLVVRAIDAVIERLAHTKGEDVTRPDAEADRTFYTTLSAVRRFALVLMLLVGVGVVLVQTELTETLGFSLLASAGAVGIVLAFAARESLSNIMASLTIAFAKTARIGDAVRFEGEWAYVEKIGFTHVRLRTWDGRRLMAPVTEFVSETFENWTKTDPSMSRYVVLVLDHRADVDLLRERFAAFLDEEDDVIDREDARVQVVGQSRDGMEVRFLFRAPDPSTGWDIHCRLREAMLKAAAELDRSAAVAEGPAFLPREREAKLEAAD